MELILLPYSLLLNCCRTDPVRGARSVLPVYLQYQLLLHFHCHMLQSTLHTQNCFLAHRSTVLQFLRVGCQQGYCYLVGVGALGAGVFGLGAHRTCCGCVLPSALPPCCPCREALPFRQTHHGGRQSRLRGAK